MASTRSKTDAALKELRAFGLNFPGTHTKSPWPGHLDLAVKDKTFAYLSIEGQPFTISCKLPHSCEAALMLPFAKPTGYGLGKSGWVSAEIPSGEVPVPLFKDWIEESYRAQAPKKLVAQLDAGGEGEKAVNAKPAAKAQEKAKANTKSARKTKPAARVRARAR